MRAPGPDHHGKPKQRGAALMIMVALLVVGFAALLVGALSYSAMNSARQERTAAALAQAKDALIGYAITYGDTHTGEVHGYLPCPDINASNGEGSSPLGSCGFQDVSQVGRLPWRTLNIGPLRDENGECLWYAVSGTYKNNPKTGLMNWDTNGLLKVYDSDGITLLTPADNQAVAVIFSPGAAQSGQNRSGTAAPVCGGNYTAGNYLDSDGTINNASVSVTANATSIFRLGTASGINDRMILITRQDIWNAIQKRTDFQSTNPNINPLIKMTNQVALCLANFGNSNNSCGWSCSNDSLPWPAPLSLGTNLLTDYYPNANYNDAASLYAGRVPYNVVTSAGSHNPLSTLMTAANCPAGWASVDPWWNNWKDHLFYALGKEFRPSSSGGQSCGGWSAQCLTIGAGSYAAVIMFAGKKLSGTTPPQTRADKSDVTHYLEGNNASSFPGANGNEDYQKAASSSTFNDILYCIDDNLNVSTC